MVPPPAETRAAEIREAPTVGVDVRGSEFEARVQMAGPGCRHDAGTTDAVSQPRDANPRAYCLARQLGLRRVALALRTVTPETTCLSGPVRENAVPAARTTRAASRDRGQARVGWEPKPAVVDRSPFLSDT